MDVRKILFSRLAFIHFVIVLLFLLIGCSTPQVIYQQVPVYIHTPPLVDTLVLRDTITVNGDSLWYGEVTDSVGKVIGDLKVYFNKKIAELKLNAKKDTVWYVDTIRVSDNTNSIVPVIVNSLTWWEQTVLFSGLGLILALLIALRFKRGKVI